MVIILGTARIVTRSSTPGEAAAGRESTPTSPRSGSTTGRVYAFNRGQHPMVVFDRDGTPELVGEGLFRRAHASTWRRTTRCG